MQRLSRLRKYVKVNIHSNLVSSDVNGDRFPISPSSKRMNNDVKRMFAWPKMTRLAVEYEAVSMVKAENERN